MDEVGGRHAGRWWRALTVTLVVLLGLASAGIASAAPGKGVAGPPAGKPAAAAVAPAFEGTLPAIDPTLGLVQATLLDRDVILVRADVPPAQLTVLDEQVGLFDAALALPVLGQPLRIDRGWGYVDVPVRNREFRFVNSHFEAFDPGLTCCHDADLRNEVVALRSRIDLILVRDGVRVREMERIGIDPAMRTPDGLWPSDHAGVVGRVMITAR